MTNNINKKNMSMDEWKAMKKAEKEAVFTMIDNTLNEIINDGEKFKSFLDTQSRTSRYSASNALLLYHQCPNASRLKTYGEWAEDHINVQKGAKSISILEPVEYTKKDGTTGTSYNVKKVFDISQTNGKQTTAPTVQYDPSKLAAIMIDTAPVNVSIVEALPIPDAGAYYDNDQQTLFIQRDIPDRVKLFQCISRELALAQFSIDNDIYNRQEMGFSAACVSYMLCKRYGVDAQNIAVNRVPESWKRKEPKVMRADMSKTRTVMNEINGRISDELYRQKQSRSKDIER